ncbi:MAG: glycosyltransferase [Lachnospiraceae bacterium]|nr:glycosyltransferase [Lachnospiraceae bacterium]
MIEAVLNKVEAEYNNEKNLGETQYRLKLLRESEEKFHNKRIALYGIGDNARFILNELVGENIVALIDLKSFGQYKYGKKVLSLEECIFLNIEVIIIAAEAKSSAIVAERILPFCVQNNISLINMYGRDEILQKQRYLQKQIDYLNVSADTLMEQIKNVEVICVELLKVLGGIPFYDQNDFLNALGEKIKDTSFAHRRRGIENKIKKRIYDIPDVYKAFSTVSFGINDSQEMCDIEEDFLIEQFIEFHNMVNIINEASRIGKKVYIYSELKLSKIKLEKLLEKIGVRNYCGIIQESIGRLTISNGLIRKSLREDFYRRKLFICSDDYSNIVLANAYEMDVCLIKDPWKFLSEISDIHIDRNLVKEEEKNNFAKYVYCNFKAPFAKEKCNGSLFQIPEYSDTQEWKRVKRENISNQLLKKIEINSFSDLEHLYFKECEVPLVSIVIPVFNHFEFTYNCLKSILTNTTGVSYEVILADDCSTDITANIKDIVSGIKVIRNSENLLFLKNCNNAAQYAQGKYILFLNNDTQVLYNWLKPLVHLLEQDSQIGLVGSKLLYPDGSLQEAGGIIWADGTGMNFGNAKNPDLKEYNYVKEVDYISGASIMIRKQLWEEIGGFDTRYVPSYYEDTDLAFEVRKCGKKVVYQPMSEVVHYEGVSNGNDINNGIKQYQEVNRMKFTAKWANILARENYLDKSEIYKARERRGNRKVVLFISTNIPTPDKDAGSVSIMSYLKLFIKKGYIVKFAATDFLLLLDYVFELEQMGIEVLCDDYYERNFDSWLIKNQHEIDYAFVNYPKAGEHYIDLLKGTSIKVRYYGHDLHYLRKKREYEISHNPEDLRLSDEYYSIESKLIEQADIVYYPSNVEEKIVIKEFGKEEVRAIPLYAYDLNKKVKEYQPCNREGIIFVGGYRHTPNVDAVVWFAKEIYPIISPRAEIPFYIVGSNEPPEVQELKAPGIIHKGFLSDEELDKLYDQVKLVIVPLRYGAGVKGKIIETLYRGIPLVSTSIGIEGIPGADKVIDVSDDAVGFADKILALYYDDERILRTVENYRNIIERNFSEEAAWQIIGNDFI